MKNLKYLILLFLILNIKNCTLIKYLDNNSNIFLARSMDFAIETFPKLIFVKEKGDFQSSSKSSNPEKEILKKNFFLMSASLFLKMMI